MVKKTPAILHHRYSLEDGHVTAQISNVSGYRGLMLTTKRKRAGGKSPFTDVISLKELEKRPELLKTHNVAAVHIHHGTLARKLWHLKKKYGIPLFVGFRGKDATAYPKKKENRKQLQKLFEIGDRFFPVCEHLKREIVKLGCPEEKIRVLYGGVDLSRFECRPRKPKEDGTIRFLAIGRFVEKKGFSDLIRAFAAVKQQYPLAKLQLVGKGPCEPEYRSLLAELQLGDSVKLIPWVDYRKIDKNYYRSHIFCAPSCTDREGNQEGIPNTLKEAMATGMPVISTYHAGIPELVEPEISGLLVPERSVPELTGAMLRLAGHPEMWDTLGRSARRKVEKDFNLKKQLKKQRKYYDEVLKSR